MRWAGHVVRMDAGQLSKRPQAVHHRGRKSQLRRGLCENNVIILGSILGKCCKYHTSSCPFQLQVYDLQLYILFCVCVCDCIRLLLLLLLLLLNLSLLPSLVLSLSLSLSLSFSLSLLRDTWLSTQVGRWRAGGC